MLWHGATLSANAPPRQERHSPPHFTSLPLQRFIKQFLGGRLADGVGIMVTVDHCSGGVLMSEKSKSAPPPAPVAAATKPKKKSKSATQKVPPKPLPPWKVLL